MVNGHVLLQYNVNVCLRLLIVLKEERVGWGIGRGREK